MKEDVTIGRVVINNEHSQSFEVRSRLGESGRERRLFVYADGKAEGASLAGITLNGHFTAHQLSELFRNRESQSSSPIFPSR